MFRSPAIWLAAIVAAIAALVVPAAASAQVGGVGFRVDQQPGSTMDAGYLTVVAAPGATGSGYFFMTNSGGGSAALRVYAADGLTGATTGVVYGAAGVPTTDAGAWITPDARGATLGPGSERRIDFTVRVPAGAAAGDHVGSVVMEQNGSGSANVSQIVRNVAPIRVIVPGAAGPQVTVRSAKITALPGTSMPAVVVTMRNTGARMCAPTLTVSMRGPSEKGAEVSRPLDMILPRDRAPYPLPWPRSIEQGSYLTKVTTTGCGTTDVLTVTLEAPASFAPVAPAGAPTAGRAPKVVTDAAPGASVFRPGKDTTTRSTKPRKRRSVRGGDDAGNAFNGSVTGGASAGDGSGSGGAGGSGGDAAGAAGAMAAGAGAKGGGGVTDWLSGAAKAVGDSAPEVIKRATFPLLLLALVGLVFFIQEAMDRRDPKLALAPLHREPHLPFDPDPLGASAAHPDPVHTVALVPLPNSGPLSQQPAR